MSCPEGRRLAELSTAVRESSLRRLRRVPRDSESWRPHPGALSFADLAHHLLVADRWLFQKLDDPELGPMTARVGEGPSGRDAFLQALEELQITGRQRAELLGALSADRFEERIPDARFGGEVTVWWLIVRGNLDHEIHHRGQIAVYLSVLRAAGGRTR